MFKWLQHQGTCHMHRASDPWVRYTLQIPPTTTHPIPYEWCNSHSNNVECVRRARKYLAGQSQEEMKLCTTGTHTHWVENDPRNYKTHTKCAQTCSLQTTIMFVWLFAEPNRARALCRQKYSTIVYGVYVWAAGAQMLQWNYTNKIAKYLQWRFRCCCWCLCVCCGRRYSLFFVWLCAILLTLYLREHMRNSINIHVSFVSFCVYDVFHRLYSM